MMTKKRILIVSLALLALLAAFVLPNLRRETSDLAGDSSFPVTSGARVELPPKDGEEIRYVYFAEDKVTKKLTQIEYRSGVTSFTFYSAEGKAKESKSFYPLKDGATKRQLRSLITYEDDGVGYKSHQVYREDGSLERNGGRLADGGYQTLYFSGSDGATQRRLVFSSEHQLSYEERFTEDGKTLLEKTEQVSENELKTTRWNEDGKKLSEISDSKDGTREGKIYREDGETVKIEFYHRGYEIDVMYFDEKGAKTLDLSYQAQGMTATTYGANGKQLYKQYLLYTGSGKTLCDVQTRLVKVEEFDQNTNYMVSRIIGVDDQGKPNRVITLLKNAYSYDRTDAELHPDGSVKTVKEYDGSNQVKSTKSFDPGKEKLNLKPEELVKPTFECLDPPESKFKTVEPTQGEEGLDD